MSNIQTLVEAITAATPGNPEKANRKLKAYAWARVSTEEQSKRGESINQQFREIREYADRKDIEIVEEFSEAVSAYNNGSKRM